MTGWINFAAVGKILVFGLLLGAGLPATFAMAVRLNTVATADGAQGTVRRPVLTWLSWALIALVVLVALLGVLYIARDFIGHHTGWYILGAHAHK